ncbi:MAG: hypothetical protein ACE5JB_01350 [bacterium]
MSVALLDLTLAAAIAGTTFTIFVYIGLIAPGESKATQSKKRQTNQSDNFLLQ